jgi:hypothetical protein
VIAPRDAFPGAAALVAGAAGSLAFVLRVLDADGTEAAFAACLLGLVAAAAAGPFTFTLRPGDRRWTPAARGALICAGLGAAAALVCGAAAVLRGGPVVPAAGVGLFCGLYALACGAVAHLLGGGVMRVAVGGVGLALLATLFFWDELFLLGAEERKASAALAFSLNPAAAASVTLGFDWIHAPVVYTQNETAESLVGVELAGVGRFSLGLGGLAAAALVAGVWRRP